jgi:hypothetical protein
VVVWSGELHTPPTMLLHLERGKKLWILVRQWRKLYREGKEKRV